MWPLLVLWAAVFTAAGWMLRSAAPGGLVDLLRPDPYRRLAAVDRRRIEAQQQRHADERDCLLAEVHGDESGW